MSDYAMVSYWEVGTSRYSWDIQGELSIQLA